MRAISATWFSSHLKACLSLLYLLGIALLVTGPALGAAASDAVYDLNQNRLIDAPDLLWAIRSMRQDTLEADFNADRQTDWRDLFLFAGRWGLEVGPGELPSDPEDVAPPIDDTVPDDIYDDSAFIYSGTDTIQDGVDPDVMEATRVAVLRGQVFVRDATSLAGVKVTVLDHPQFGWTYTRADGKYDLVVNGGTTLTLHYEHSGYLPAQRQVTVPWRDYTWLPDVALVPLDSRVTPIDFSQPQVAQGSVVTDEAGSRQATLFFPQGTQAKMATPGGPGKILNSLSVRLTEYTVGENGADAMPALLPPQIAYTYCVELTADEAGTDTVEFSQPVAFYLENYLDFPVGDVVPVGYYDRAEAAWVPSQNGRIVEVIAVHGGVADLDIDGDGAADDEAALTALGVTDEERLQLGELYAAGQSLWRVPLTHFSPWDCNWPWGLGEGAEAPGQGPPEGYDPEDRDCPDTGSSIIECRSQVLGERIPLTGTPMSLNYRSSNAIGLKAAYTVTIPLTGETLPEGLKRVELEVRIAGQRHEMSFLPNPSFSHTFTWDGKDGYGRRIPGKAQATIRIGYTYDGVYMRPTEMRESFNSFGTTEITGSRSLKEITLWQEWKHWLGVYDGRGRGLGGWSLDVHHVYDPDTRLLYLGSGERRSAEALPPIILTVAGDGTVGFPGTGPDFAGDNGPALEAQMGEVRGAAVGADGTLYIADAKMHRVRQVDSAGIITTLAGSGFAGFSGDGGAAVEAALSSPGDVAIGPDGSVYIADTGNHRIRRVWPNGVIATVAGVGTAGFSGDGFLALMAQLDSPNGVAFAPDGSLYISDSGNKRIRRVGPGGLITTIAGNGEYAVYDGEPAPAREVPLLSLTGVAVGLDGSVFLTDMMQNRVCRIGPDGILTPAAGNGTAGFSGDGGPATEARLSWPSGVAVGPDGTLYIADAMNCRIRRVSPDGIITTLAGNGELGYSGENVPATDASFMTCLGVAIGPDKAVYVADKLRVRRISSALPGYAFSDFIVVSEDGNRIYRFDRRGRHQQTLRALTGQVLYDFDYLDRGFLWRVTDSEGRVTVIHHDSEDNPAALVGPYGQRTELSLNGYGFLAGVVTPAGETYECQYTYDGLLTHFKDLRGYSYEYTYDDDGLLLKAEDPAGGFKALERTSLDSGYQVSMTTALGRVKSYRVERLPSDETRFANTLGCCGEVEVRLGTDGTETTTYADGSIVIRKEGPDPRWGMQSPRMESLSHTLPSGLSREVAVERQAELADRGDRLSLTRMITTVNVNGDVYSAVYEATGRQLMETSPEGRRVVWGLDEDGRLSEFQYKTLAPIGVEYDSDGRPNRITEGSGDGARVHQVGYNSAGYLESITDPLGRTISYEYSATGRVSKIIRPDGEEILYTYDANGNLLSLTPPGRPAHQFDYTVVNQRQVYRPPVPSAGSWNTGFVYDLDRKLISAIQADGRVLGAVYDTEGRLSKVTTPRGDLTYAYDAGTSQLSSITRFDGAGLSYEYDGPFVLSETWSGEVAGSVGRSYNNRFRLAALEVNGAHRVEYLYDADGALLGAGDLMLSREADTGLVMETSLGQVTTQRVYNDFGEVVQYEAFAGGSSLLRLQYTLNAMGRIVEVAETLGGETITHTYTCDANGWLTRVSRNGSTTVAQYEYDANGNRLRYTNQQGTITTADYDDQDRLLQYDDAEYTYTPHGELRSRTDSGLTTTFAYDVFGNLRSATMPNGTVIEYLVDGRDRRIGKKVNGASVQGFLYKDQLNPVAELDGANQVMSVFVYAHRSNIPAYMIKGGKTYRMISDSRGSPRLVVDVASGEIAQRMDYDVFGRVILDTNPGFQPFGFAGGLYDPDTGLVRFGERDYDPILGRWTAKDPIDFAGGSPNLYLYALNDPVNFIDPSGLRNAPWSQEECVNMAVDLMKKADCFSGTKQRQLRKEAGEYFDDCNWVIDNWDWMSSSGDEGPDRKPAQEWGRKMNQITKPMHDAWLEEHTETQQQHSEWIQENLNLLNQNMRNEIIERSTVEANLGA